MMEKMYKSINEDLTSFCICLELQNSFKTDYLALTGVDQWVGHCTTNWKVTGLLPSQGTCLDCRPGPQLGACKRQPVHVSLPLFLPLFPSKEIILISYILVLMVYVTLTLQLLGWHSGYQPVAGSSLQTLGWETLAMLFPALTHTWSYIRSLCSALQ